MSYQDEKQDSGSLPGIPSNHPANLGLLPKDPPEPSMPADQPTNLNIVRSEQESHIMVPASGPLSPALSALRAAPPLEWPAATPAEQKSGEADRARFDEVKQRVVDADPSTLKPAEQFAREVARSERDAAEVAAPALAAEASAASIMPLGEPAPNVRKTRATKAKAQDRVEAEAKPARKSRSKKAAAEQDQNADAEQSKPARTPRKKTVKTADVPDLATTGPAPSGGYALPVPPPITSEAITFLANPHSTTADFFKLGQDSQAFVKYHITDQQRLEANAALTYSHLMATAPRLSPAMQKVTDVLLANAATIRANLERKNEPSRSEIAPAAPPGLAQSAAEAEKNPFLEEDTKRAHGVIGNAYVLMSSPVGGVTREVARDMVSSDVEAVKGIQDQAAKGLALEAMAASKDSHPHYKAQLEQQAPNLVPNATAKDTVHETKARPTAPAQEAENTIERGPEINRVTEPAKLREGESKDQPADATKQPDSTSATARAGADPLLRPSLGKHLLLAIGDATQKAGGWLSDLGKAAPARASGAGPVSLAKPAAPAEQTAGAAPADDKTYVVPESVTRRFLKVDKEYFFLDKTPAFSDRGEKLATRGNHPDVVRSLVEIAKARGWDSITVKGTDEFRRSAWMEAYQHGLKVEGYKPTALDLAELANRPAKNVVEKGVERERDQDSAQHEAKSAPAASVQADAATAKGNAVKPAPELVAKAKSFENDKPGFVVKKYPDLAPAYGVIAAARAFANEKLPEDVREAFVGIARRHVIEQITKGEQVQGPKILAQPAKTQDAPEQATAKEAVDLGKSPREKVVAKER